MRIAFIGFGEAARAFRQSLAEVDPTLIFSANDILLDSEGLRGKCAEAMRQHGVRIGSNPAAAIESADWVFSAVTAGQSFHAARAIAPCLADGQILFDINSVSPQRKRDSAALVGAERYVDMAVMAPVHPKGHRAPVLLAGPVAPAMLAQLAELGFDAEIAGPNAGDATAIKMVRSLFVKGLEALTVETWLAAQASGCLDYIERSLDKSYPGLGLPKLATYQFERTLKHGKRRAAEMRESARTLDELGLTGALADRIADVQDAMGKLDVDAAPDDALHDIVAKVLAARRG